MCGIAGILSTQADTNLAAPVAAMQEALSHRGPNDRGDFFCSTRQAAFAHTRLAIIDLSKAARQPMGTPDGRYTITFNGEIYNYRKLRSRLEAEGDKFQSNSDTEVILKMYARKGSQCVHFLRGMFAFVIWDSHKKIAFAARDPLGIKPLYYLKSADNFAFSSELRSLIACGLSTQKLSSRGLAGYLMRGTVQEPDTLIEDIRMLPAGSQLTWRKGKAKVQRYWRLKYKTQRVDQKTAIEMTRLALEDSVRAHLVSDVPVGIFLSGGIDSTALLAMAKKATRKPINTYSIAFGNPEWNEGDIAAKTAKHFGTNHTEFLLSPTEAQPLFYEFLNAVDQPTIDGFNTYCIAQLASKAGEKVVLSGLGADELFAGYKSFELIPEILEKSQKLSFLSSVLRATSKITTLALPAKQRRMLDALCEPSSVFTAHRSLRGIFSTEEAAALAKSISNEPVSWPKSREPYAQELSDKIAELEMTTYMRNQLLRDSDVASMAFGLELRVPFVDKVLIDRINTIPAELRLRQGKKLLIEAVPEIPNWVLERPKQGFRFPFDEWFSDQWSDMTIHASPKWIPQKPWYRRWALAVLSDWKERHAK